jgi:glyoxalase family protein
MKITHSEMKSDPGSGTTTPDALLGIHHITALATDPQRTADFYTNVLGLRLVKRTVNFDAPDVYHLYFGDAVGSPGTILTFFPFPRAAQGTKGAGEVSAVAFGVPANSRDYWIRRLSEGGLHIEGPSMRLGEEMISIQDPDGLTLDFSFRHGARPVKFWMEGPVAVQHAITRIVGATMVVSRPDPTSLFLTATLGFQNIQREEDRTRFQLGFSESQAFLDIIASAKLPPAQISAGSVHHIAWRAAGDTAQQYWHTRLSHAPTHVTGIIDRRYFRSIYFHEPGGVLFEIATDPPGFLGDEPVDSLGTALMLPPWLEPQRKKIERMLPPIAAAKAASMQTTGRPATI